MGKSKKSKLPLFDIRVHSVDKDTILLKGSPSTAPPTLLSGVIALSVTEPFQIKKMRLKLYATLSLHWDDKYHNNKGQSFSHPFKFTKMVYCFDWDPINLEKFLNTHNPLQSSFAISRSPSTNSLENLTNNVGFTTGTLISSNPGSSSNLQRVGSTTTIKSKGSTTSIPKSTESPVLSSHTRNKSATSISAMNLSSLTSFGGGGGGGGISGLNESVTLEPGNYEFPFQLILDGSIPESIVDHPCCSLIYRLQCSIEKGRFTTPIYSRKLLHVVRTLSPDNTELSETIAVENTWPEKIDYSISVPTKAIAIGSTCQIFMNMSPLCKGLKLGSIKIKLMEYGSFSTITGHHSSERTLTTKHIPKITHNSDGIDIWSENAPIDENGVFYRTNHISLSNDKWDIKTSIQLPPTLELMTQDLDVLNVCKVRHKLKFSVGLINPDGHISELRATLPITLFISPFVPIKVKTIDSYEDPFLHLTIDDVTHHTSDENMLFQHENVDSTAIYNSLHQSDSTGNATSTTTNTTTNNNTSLVPTPNATAQDFMAPPKYDDRIYDRVYDLNSDEDPLNETPLIDPTLASGIELPTSPTNPNHQTENPPNPEVVTGFKNNESSRSNSESSQTDESVNENELDPFSNEGSPKIDKHLRKYKKPIFSIAGDDDDEENYRDGNLDPFANPSSNTHLPPPEYPIVTQQRNVISGPAFESGERMPISRLPSSAHLQSPDVMTPVQHLSRATSFIGGLGSAPLSAAGLSSLNNSSNSHMDEKLLKEMSNPPSYEVAIHSSASMKDLTPVYIDDTDLKSNLHILDSRLRNLRLSRLDQQKPKLTKSSKSTTALNKDHSTNHSPHPLLKRSSFGFGILSHSGPLLHAPPPSTPPAMSRNVSSNSLLSKRLMKHSGNLDDQQSQHSLHSVNINISHSHSHSHNNHISKSPSVRFDIGSPNMGSRSVVSTPGAMPDSYFSLHDVVDGNGYDDMSSTSTTTTTTTAINISQPKAAHLPLDNANLSFNSMMSGTSGSSTIEGNGKSVNSGVHLNMLRSHFH